MPLVEGLGDEVTIILALLTIIIVLLIAWLSTHTRDIPFFSVIVVELSQRASRNQQARRSQTPENQQQSSNQENNDSASPLTDERTVHEEPALPTSGKQTVTQNIRRETIENTVVVENSDSNSASSGPHSVTDENEINESVSELNPSNISQDVTNAESLARPEVTDANSKCDASQSQNNDVSQTDNTDSVVSSISESVGETVPQSESSEHGEVRHRTVPSSGQSLNPPSVANPLLASDTVTSSDFLESSTSDHIGQIRIRLKYLNDTQRLVYSSPTDTIGQFRRAHFSTELAANKLVRLIFNGQDMRNDTNTLQGYNITDNSVIHCLITQNLQGTATPHMDAGDADVQLGSFMMPLFAIILAAMWYLRITQRQYFNAVSTLSLAGVTFLFILGCASVWRNGTHREHQHME